MNPPHKSLIANFSALMNEEPNQTELQEQADSAVEVSKQSQSTRVGAGVIGATQRSLSEIREERDRLREMVEKGSGEIELDPRNLDPSPFPDRLPDDDDQAFSAFKATIEVEGQKLPIFVRPHPTDASRYQIGYGHRRWRAAKELERPVRALVADLSDRDLVVIQGLENGQRQDLTWIERALFASRMENEKVKPRDIKAALTIDDAELAKFRAVCRNLPTDVLEAIGRAPKIGRPRWLSLAKFASDGTQNIKRIRKTLSADKVSNMTSTDRFNYLLSSLQSGKEEARDIKIELTAPSGDIIGSAKIDGRKVQLNLNKDQGEKFAEFMQRELPRLMERYNEDQN